MRPLTFTVIGPGPAPFEIVSGTPQEGVTGQPIQFPFITRVLDGQSNPLAGQDVLYEVIAGSGNFAGTTAVTVATDGSGLSTSPVLTWVAGPVRVRASLPGTEMTRLEFFVSENWAPMLSVLDRPGNTWFTNQTNFQMTGEVLELHLVSLQLNGTPLTLPAGGQGLFQMQISLTEGANPVEVRAVDFYGAVTVRTFTVVLDTSAPVLTVASPPTLLTTTALRTVALRGTVNEPATIVVEGAAFPVAPDGTFYVPSLELTNAESDMIVYAFDRAGNVSSQNPPTYEFATAQPRTAISLELMPQGPTPGQTVTFTVRVEGTLSIAAVRYDFETDGAIDFTGNTLSASHAFPAPGRYVVTALAELADGVTTSATREVMVFDPMQVTGSVSIPGAFDLETSGPRAFVLSRTSGKVTVLKSDLTVEREFIGDFLSAPEGIALGSGESVYIADTGNHRVQKWEFDAACGEYRLAAAFGNGGSAGGFGDQPGQFKDPRDLVEVDGSLLVLDSGNGRVQVLGVHPA